MRCRNCHTVMMETDLECPICHASAASATAPAPQPMNNKPNGMLMALPIFGGAIGGAILGAVKLAEAANTYSPPPRAGAHGAVDIPLTPSPGFLKKLLGVMLLLGAGLFLLLALVHF